jgi:hypothetical protein
MGNTWTLKDFEASILIVHFSSDGVVPSLASRHFIDGTIKSELNQEIHNTLTTGDNHKKMSTPSSLPLFNCSPACNDMVELSILGPGWLDIYMSFLLTEMVGP